LLLLLLLLVEEEEKKKRRENSGNLFCAWEKLAASWRETYEEGTKSFLPKAVTIQHSEPKSLVARASYEGQDELETSIPSCAHFVRKKKGRRQESFSFDKKKSCQCWDSLS
jgi:hypothetical protein